MTISDLAPAVRVILKLDVFWDPIRLVHLYDAPRTRHAAFRVEAESRVNFGANVTGNDLCNFRSERNREFVQYERQGFALVAATVLFARRH